MIHDDHVHLRPHIKPPPPHDLECLAAEAKMRGIIPGIREHAPLPAAYRLGEFRDFEFAMMDNELERFISLFDGAGVHMGLEVDYLRGCETETEIIMNGIFDEAKSRGIEISGVNGSVHLLPGDVEDLGVDKGDIHDIIWDLDDSIFMAHIKQRGAAGMIDDYFARMEELVETRLFDTLSHIELIRKFDVVGADGKSIYFGEVESLYRKRAEKVLESVADAGMAVEINTAGCLNKLGRPYLSRELLEVCAALKIPICVGSDTHKPYGLANNFDLAYKMCRTAGITALATIRNRKIEYYGL